MKLLPALVFLASLSTVAVADVPAGHPPMGDTGMTGQPSEAVLDSKLTQQGKVVSFLDTKGYTYIEVTRESKTVWLAVPTTAVKIGDTVRFEDAPAMLNYQSKSLGKTFPAVIFVARVIVSSGAK
jgi:hypothetical protein